VKERIRIRDGEHHALEINIVLSQRHRETARGPIQI